VLWSHPASRIVWEHNLHLDAKDTLAKEHVADGPINVLPRRITGGDHVAIRELHALGTLTPDLARQHDLDTEGTALHDEADHAIASPTGGEASKKLVAEGLGLGDSAEATVEHLLSVQLNGSRREVETLLHDGSELANAAALLSQHVLGTGGTDDDLVAGRRLADFHTGVTILSQLTLEELVELSIEDPIDAVIGCIT